MFIFVSVELIGYFYKILYSVWNLLLKLLESFIYHVSENKQEKLNTKKRIQKK